MARKQPFLKFKVRAEGRTFNVAQWQDPCLTTDAVARWWAQRCNWPPKDVGPRFLAALSYAPLEDPKNGKPRVPK